MQRFLIIQTAFLGDVILATPLFSELKRIYPNAIVHAVVRKGNESLLSNNPYIDQLFVWNKNEGKYKTMIRLIKDLRKTKYDEIINLQRFSSSGIITWFCKADTKIGFDNASLTFVYNKKIMHRIGDGRHEIKRNLSTIQHHGAVTLKRPELYPSEKEKTNVQIYKAVGEYYCLAPASVWFTKQLPLAKWKELITILTRQNKTVYLLGAKSDEKLCKELASEHHLVISLAGKLNLLESASLMQNAKRSYVNDSGPLHLASAMNSPVTAFFCSTTPYFGFGPLSEDAQILETSDTLSCRPCGLHGHRTCPKQHFKCGMTIDITKTKI